MNSFFSEALNETENDVLQIQKNKSVVFDLAVRDLRIGIVIIANFHDSPYVEKLFQKIEKLLNNYKNLFIEFAGDVKPFEIFDEILTELIESINQKEKQKFHINKKANFPIIS
jgi:hypothetical protein